MPTILKAHDTFPPLSFALTDLKGPVNLTTATQVLFLMKGNGILVDGICTITNPALGLGVYNWVAGDTALAGTFQVEFQVMWAGGGIQTFPSDGTLTIVIEADLGP